VSKEPVREAEAPSAPKDAETAAFFDVVRKANSHFSQHYEFLDLKTPTLYHYTTGSGLVGIIESKSLFATHIHFLNDASEVLHSSEVAARVFEECAKSAAPIEGVPAQYVIENGRSLFKGGLAIGNQAFVASFCENHDLLSQWRGYAMEGYAIGFESLDGMPLANSAAHKNAIRKVIYRYEEKKRELLRLLAATIKAKDSVPHGEDRKVIQDIISAFSYILLETWTHTVKHEKFEEEHEWRIVSWVAANRPPLSMQKDDFFMRVNNGHLIPTIRLRPKAALLPISSITCGPNANGQLAEEGIRMLLDGGGYDRAVKVRHSEVPFRPRY
jgi:hypothetical protein